VKLFSAILHHEAIVIAQIRVPPATTEVTQVKELLDPVDLTGAVVIGDAAHTRHATAECLIGRDADYVLTLKANQPTLLGQVAAKLFATADGPRHREEDRSHGRIVHRQIQAAPADGIDFPGAAQIFRIRRDVFDLAGQRLSKEVVHGITSLTVEQATAQALAGWVRTHWGSRTRATTYATSCSAKTTSTPTLAHPPRPWPPSVTSPSACYAWPGQPRSNEPSNASRPTEPESCRSSPHPARDHHDLVG
jgi:predicted transposase YbfD/YdcC